MKDLIIAQLEQHGWKKDRIVDAFSKVFKTAVSPKRASIWLRLDHEFPRWWLTDGDFTSAGENVLAATSTMLPLDMSPAALEHAITAFVEEMESKIAGAWSVRLLGLPIAQAVAQGTGADVSIL